MKISSDDILKTVLQLKSEMKTLKVNGEVLDIVGTGGDGQNTVNISTGAAILAASCGVPVVKHGNRSVTSMCGSADVLEAMGVNIHSDFLHCKSFKFCFAPNYHPEFLKIKELRKHLNVPTKYNVLGPLLNPANANYLLIGIADPSLMHPMADVLIELNVKRGILFHCDGLDELCTLGPVYMIEINQGQKQSLIFDATEFGFNQCQLNDLVGGDANHNAACLIEVFKGAKNAIADALILNAGFAQYIFGLVDSVDEGIQIAKQTHEQGRAYQLLQEVCYVK